MAKYKSLVIAKVPTAICVRTDLGGEYVYRVWTNVYGNNEQLSEAKSPRVAWKRAYGSLQLEPV